MKYSIKFSNSSINGRPRKGAWIEISAVSTPALILCRPRKGAWIEIAGAPPVLSRYASPPQGGVD